MRRTARKTTAEPATVAAILDELQVMQRAARNDLDAARLQLDLAEQRLARADELVVRAAEVLGVPVEA